MYVEMLSAEKSIEGKAKYGTLQLLLVFQIYVILKLQILFPINPINILVIAGILHFIKGKN